ncbi:MAG: diaminopimelate decarboxylase [Ignavibacteria bacterium]|jgi:diaminopimelate decarboxylase
MHSRLSKDHISTVFKKALEEDNILNNEDTASIFYDLTYIKERITNLVGIFPDDTFHTIAIKANPLIAILRYMNKLNVGLEAATIPELYLAKKTGYTYERVVFDSPTKTLKDLEYALNFGCHINADSLPELDRIAEFMKRKDFKTKSTIGVRINPQVGTGEIVSTSVAGIYSKFGVPIEENRQVLIDRFEKYDWLTGVHLHIGSQGCPVDMLIQGIEKVLNFTNEVNEILEQKKAKHKIVIFDLGGGLPVSYHHESQGIPMEQYVGELRKHFPKLFSSNFKLITEFGRYIHANSGWVASKVEYVKRESKINTAMIHVGADLFLRKCYRPEDWHHEIFVLDNKGDIKTGIDNNKYTIAGPLCFAGDILAGGIELPVVNEGDYIIIQDTGAYTLSMWSRYNSRQIPKVIGYHEDGKEFEIIKKRETLEEIIDFWG